jgi:uncharacterized protein (DUF1810 family)
MSPASDVQRFDLQRFVDAQEPVYAAVVEELRSGTKRTHWMWFVFPNIAGLGASAMARHYAIGSLAEARAYAAHPVLGARLVECTRLVLAARPKSLRDILGTPDDLKFHSCVTLFALLDEHDPVFDEALASCWDGALDERTVVLAGTG